MIRAVVVDSEPLARDRLARLLAATGKVEIVGTAEDARTALRLCRRYQRPAGIGPVPGEIEGEPHQCKQRELPLYLFVTELPHHTIAAFEVHVADCLLKSPEPERVEQAVAFLDQRPTRTPLTVAKHGAPEMDRLPVRLRERDVAHLLERHEIVAVLRKGRRTWIHTRQAEYPSYLPVSRIEDWLGGSPFLRAARDAIVNLDQVAEIVHFGDRLYQLRLKDRQQTEVKASRSAASHLARCLRPSLEGR